MSDAAPEVTTGDKIRYQVDRFLSWSPFARFIGLFGLSFILVSFCATLAVIVMPARPEGEDPFDFLEAMWWAMTRVADAGTMGDDSGTLVRLVATMSTLSGVMVVALLIGLVSSTIGDKLEDLRKGKSPVIDEGHTLILGFGEKIYAILRELIEANSNNKGAAIVILSELDKEEVENAVKDRIPDTRTTRIVVRQGSTFAPHDLQKCGAGRARSIIVLAHETQSDESESEIAGHVDMHAIKTLLALRRIPGTLTKNHITIELIEVDRRAVVERLGGGGVEVVAMRDTLSRLMVQTVRQRGIAECYRDLLQFDGSEFYFKGFPELAGRPFGEVQWRMKDAVVVGVRRQESNGKVNITLNPKDDFVLAGSDQLLVLAEDDDTFSLLPSGRDPQVVPGFQGTTARQRVPERILIVSFRESVRDVLKEFDNYVMPGSEVWLMPGRPKPEVAEVLQLKELGLKNLALKFVDGDPVEPDSLKAISGIDFSSVMVVADDRLDEQEADARTVISIFLLRDLFAATNRRPRLISEILDPRTKDLVESDGAADFVVSSEITSMLLAQVSERRELNAVFADLFDSDGNEIYFKRSACYTIPGQPTSFLAIQKVARQRGEVAIGYYSDQIHINPPQEASLTLSETDRVIVVSEDDSEAASGTGGSQQVA